MPAPQYSRPLPNSPPRSNTFWDQVIILQQLVDLEVLQPDTAEHYSVIYLIVTFIFRQGKCPLLTNESVKLSCPSLFVSGAGRHSLLFTCRCASCSSSESQESQVPLGSHVSWRWLRSTALEVLEVQKSVFHFCKIRQKWTLTAMFTIISLLPDID